MLFNPVFTPFFIWIVLHYLFYYKAQILQSLFLISKSNNIYLFKNEEQF